MSGRYEASCQSCDFETTDQAEASEHLRATLEESEESRSHRLSVLDRTGRRQAREAIEAAIDRAVTDLIELLERGEATREEIEQEIFLYSNFEDEWRGAIEDYELDNPAEDEEETS